MEGFTEKKSDFFLLNTLRKFYSVLPLPYRA